MILELKYIIGICVTIDIAILGIAYPIIIDKISNIGDKYSSEYLSVVFNNEFPQKGYKFTRGISVFKLLIFATLFSFVFLIFTIPSPFGWDNWLVSNFAKLVVFVFTVPLIIFFFIWLKKVALYNGKSTSLLTHLINNYNKSKEDTEIKNYHLKAINELTLYAIEKQDEHLQETLLKFYYSIFTGIRKKHEKPQPLVYPIDLYFLVNKLTKIAVKNETKLKAIEQRAVSGTWLLGGDFKDIVISKNTYNYLWNNIYIICDNPRLIKMFWANSSQYFNYQLQSIKVDYNSEQCKEEQKQFLEFHLALGGLLLYRKQYKTLNYLFEYSHSDPPRYVLLPEKMTQIFYWFEHFSNKFKHNTPIDFKYSFPELDNLGNSRQVIDWICNYITILFLRQYSLHPHYIFQDFTTLPDLPDDILELSSWLGSIPFFEKCLNNVLSNKKLIADLNLKKIVTEKKDNFASLIGNLKKAIKNKIGERKLNAPLSDKEIQEFYSQSNEEISKTFEWYKSIFITKDDEYSKGELKLRINGERTLISKSAFIDDDTSQSGENSFFAEAIAMRNIKCLIPNAFFIARTKQYLFNKDNILTALTKIINNNNDIVVIGVNITYQTKEILKNSKFKEIIEYIPSTEFYSQDTLFVLRKKDLPAIEHRDLSEDEKTEFQLKCINEELKLYASVIDINTDKNKAIKDKWNLENKSDNEDVKVLLTIAFLSIIHWKNEREVIQINIASEYQELGIQNDLRDIPSSLFRISN